MPFGAIDCDRQNKYLFLGIADDEFMKYFCNSKLYAMVKKILFYISICCAVVARGAVLDGTVLDGADGSPLPACAVAFAPGGKGASTDLDGHFRIVLSPGRYKLRASYVGFDDYTRAITIGSRDTAVTITLTPARLALGEVTVTADEGRSATSASRIDRSAMEHLQPSSLTDVLELLPGNISQNPRPGAVNSIKLRETGSLGATGTINADDDYAISALGTQFNIDGAPINTDANLQSIGTLAADGRSSLNRGVDMRSISTDNIESVEVIRGIPSAEYGNLSSGMVNIRRCRAATPYTARFKADGFSKLLFAGKGFAVGPQRRNTLNADIGWLDSKIDPRDNLENYSRLTASVRSALHMPGRRVSADWNIAADVNTTLDRAKADPDLSLTKIDIYRSRRTELSATSALTLNFEGLPWLESVDFNLSGNYTSDRLERQLQVAPARATVAPGSTGPGVHDGHYILGEYIADYVCDGKPVSFYAKLRATGDLPIWQGASQRYKIGADFSLTKNLGKGQIYDLSRPLSASWTSRPRDFSTIPALRVAGAFIEDALTVPVGANVAELQAGLRVLSLAGLDSRYYLSGRPYPDPRVNLVWRFPAFGIAGHRADLFLAGGYGLSTRMPTADYLFPQVAFLDILQLNYYDTSKPLENSRVNIRTYINDAVNYALRPARNAKYEIRFGANIGSNRLNITYFEEHMNDGFRYSPQYASYAYRLYDPSGIAPGSLIGPPDLADLPYVDTSVLRSFRRAENGSRIDKRGVEYTLSTARWAPLATALTINGAWFRTRYSNSMMLFDPVGDVVDNVAVSDRYVGLYDTADGRVNEQFNTNFMFDTQLPRLGLVFTTTLQCMWYVKTRRLAENGTPTAYISSADGKLHPYDAAAAADPMLRYLERYYNPALYDNYSIPTALYVNFKATKTIGRYLRVAVFVNRIIDYLPDFNSGGLTVRRSSDAYFGMEVNVKI